MGTEYFLESTIKGLFCVLHLLHWIKLFQGHMLIIDKRL